MRVRLALPALVVCLVAGPARATRTLSPKTAKYLMMRRNLALALKVQGQAVRKQRSTTTTTKGVKVKIKVKRVTTVKTVKTGIPKRRRIGTNASGRRLRRRIVRRQTSSISLLKAVLGEERTEANPKQPGNRSTERIRPAPRTRQPVVVSEGGKPPPSTLERLKYQMDLLQMSEALR